MTWATAMSTVCGCRMPITIDADRQGLDLYVVFEGDIAPEDVTAYFQRITAAGTSFAGFRTLIEIRTVRFSGFNFRSIAEFARLTRDQRSLLEGSRTAVVTRGSVAYGLARMYVSIRDPDYDFAIFRDTDAARHWLDADVETTGQEGDG